MILQGWEGLKAEAEKHAERIRGGLRIQCGDSDKHAYARPRQGNKQMKADSAMLHLFQLSIVAMETGRKAKQCDRQTRLGLGPHAVPRWSLPPSQGRLLGNVFAASLLH